VESHGGFKTIPQGAATSVWAAVVAPADEVGGQYCENCHVGKSFPDDVICGNARVTGKPEIVVWSSLIASALGIKALRGLVADSASAAIGTLRYSWLVTAFVYCASCFLLSFFFVAGDIGAQVGRERQTFRWFSGYAAAVAPAGSGAMPPRITAAVC
jgi:hypothetical protein